MDTEDDAVPESLVRQLGRLVLMQQEQLQCMQRASGITMHLGRDPARGVVPSLIEVSQAWKSTYQANPQNVNEALRVLLFKSVMASLHHRLGLLPQTLPLTEDNRIFLTDQLEFFEVMWNVETEELLPKPGGRVLAVPQVVRTLEELSTLCHADSIERLKMLKPLHKLSPTMVVPMLLVPNSMTRSGMRLYELMHSLFDLSLWRLIDATTQGDRGKSTPLADIVRKKIYRTRGDS